MQRRPFVRLRLPCRHDASMRAKPPRGGGPRGRYVAFVAGRIELDQHPNARCRMYAPQGIRLQRRCRRRDSRYAAGAFILKRDTVGDEHHADRPSRALYTWLTSSCARIGFSSKATKLRFAVETRLLEIPPPVIRIAGIMTPSRRSRPSSSMPSISGMLKSIIRQLPSTGSGSAKNIIVDR